MRSVSWILAFLSVPWDGDVRRDTRAWCYIPIIPVRLSQGRLGVLGHPGLRSDMMATDKQWTTTTTKQNKNQNKRTRTGFLIFVLQAEKCLQEISNNNIIWRPHLVFFLLETGSRSGARTKFELMVSLLSQLAEIVSESYHTWWELYFFFYGCQLSLWPSFFYIHLKFFLYR